MTINVSKKNQSLTSVYIPFIIFWLLISTVTYLCSLFALLICLSWNPSSNSPFCGGGGKATYPTRLKLFHRYELKANMKKPARMAGKRFLIRTRTARCKVQGRSRRTRPKGTTKTAVIRIRHKSLSRFNLDST